MVNLILRSSLIIILFLCYGIVFSQESYFFEHAKGWHWYDDPKNVDIEENEEKDPVTQMNAIRATIQRALDQAVINPTKENVKNYIEVQNQLTNHANQFNHNWQAVLLENPMLNYSILHPTNNLAKQVEYDQIYARDEKLIKNFAKKFQLYFFYKSTCPYCQRFSPIVKDLAEHYGFNILPITMDGISLPEFPDSYIDQGEAEIFKVHVEPALFAVNPLTHQALSIMTGLASQAEIKKNIIALLTHFEGDVK